MVEIVCNSPMHVVSKLFTYTTKCSQDDEGDVKHIEKANVVARRKAMKGGRGGGGGR